jgi:trigger factor
MSVVVSLQDVGPCRKQLTVEVPAPAVEAETLRVTEEYGRNAKIPGFRQGKVPKHLVRQRFAKDIEREVVERLLPRYWRQAQAESSIDPLLPPELSEEPVLRPGEPMIFVAEVEVRPQIELRNTKGFELPDPSMEPGTFEVDETIDDLRRQIAPWKAIERPAARGDQVTAEITALPVSNEAESGEASAEAAEPKSDTIQVEIGDQRVWEELSLALTGLTPGRETTFTRHEEAVQHGDHEHPAKDRQFRIKVTEVQERELPLLDDEFAKQVSPEFTSVESLREAVTARLRANRETQRREQREKALLDQLRERHPLELPQGVVRREVEQLTQEYAENLARRGMDVEKSGIDWNQVASDMLPLAERRVHARLLLDAVTEAESIEVGEEEFERTLATLARSQGTTTPALRKALDENGRLATLRAQLRREKTIRHLLGEPVAEEASASPLLAAMATEDA